jgi:co-chaperonin GroES (HSP10)
MKSALAPLGDGIAVELIEKYHTAKDATLGFDVRVSDGGVALPDMVDTPQCEGRVVTVGPGRVETIPLSQATRIAEALYHRGYLDIMNEEAVEIATQVIVASCAAPKPMTVHVGDHVIFQPHAMTSVPVDGKELHLITERDVLGIVLDG